jgi:hypothetical protein
MVALAAGSVAVVGLGLCLLVGWFFISYFRCPSGPLDTGPECGDTIPLATIFNTLAQAMLCVGVVTVALLRLSARVQVGLSLGALLVGVLVLLGAGAWADFSVP